MTEGFETESAQGWRRRDQPCTFQKERGEKGEPTRNGRPRLVVQGSSARRLAEAVANQKDSVVATLLALTVEFEAKAAALTARGGKCKAN
jgi:hypothetical protein